LAVLVDHEGAAAVAGVSALAADVEKFALDEVPEPFFEFWPFEKFFVGDEKKVEAVEGHRAGFGRIEKGGFRRQAYTWVASI
jgi:hypothetical protein